MLKEDSDQKTNSMMNLYLKICENTEEKTKQQIVKEGR